MELEGRTAVITGAASGIGRAMALRFARAGARVVVSDIDQAGAEAVAGVIEADGGPGVTAVACDVASGSQTAELIDAAEAVFGPVDLFCANAGIGGGYDLDTPDDSWDHAFAVNVRAHMHAARRLVPGWVARREGYFLSTASAAGLLTAIGSATYTASKHAAVGFAEWLAITYGDRGVRVSCLCPMGVDTRLLNELLDLPAPERLGGEVILSSGALLQPHDVAEAVVEGLRAERFLILPHPEVKELVRGKAGDHDAWLTGMRALQAHTLRRLEVTA